MDHVKKTDDLQVETEDTKHKGETKGADRQDEQGTYEDGTKKTDVLQVETEDTRHKDETRGAEHQAKTRLAYPDIINYVKENDCIQAEEDGENRATTTRTGSRPTSTRTRPRPKAGGSRRGRGRQETRGSG